ncbi:MAG: helix-turn-helix transcriptional regulator, partial [Alphaproteobacteria bacterium]|nr:helix-turn-helix transcriptional regulator [Alphaproteobacteria bacterium]
MPASIAVESSDPSEYEQAVLPAQMQVFATVRGPFEARIVGFTFDRVLGHRGYVSLPCVTHTALGSKRAAVFFLADAEQKPMFNSGREVCAEDMVLYARGSEHHNHALGACHAASMSMLAQDFAFYGQTLLGKELRAPETNQVVRPSAAAMSRLRSLHKAAGDLAVTAPDLLNHPEVSKAIEQELIHAMVGCLTESMPAGSERNRSQSMAVMRRFARVLEEGEDSPFYLAEICAAVGVSERSLRLHCAEHLGMSPHRYLWLRRMNLARRSLVVA